MDSPRSTTATPATASPVTASPVTASSVTATPSIAPPSIVPLNTAFLSTASPSTDSPSTDSPSTDSPSTDSPSTDSPSTDSPSSESSGSESSGTASPRARPCFLIPPALYSSRFPWDTSIPQNLPGRSAPGFPLGNAHALSAPKPVGQMNPTQVRVESPQGYTFERHVAWINALNLALDRLRESGHLTIHSPDGKYRTEIDIKYTIVLN